MGTTGHEALASALRAGLPDGFEALSDADAARLDDELRARLAQHARSVGAYDALGPVGVALEG